MIIITVNSDTPFTLHIRSTSIAFPLKTHIIANVRSFRFLSCPFLLVAACPVDVLCQWDVQHLRTQ